MKVVMFFFRLLLYFIFMMNHTIFIDLLNMTGNTFSEIFTEIEILSRNGWFETILVLFVRLKFEKAYGKVIGNAFILLCYLLTPVVVLQKTITSDKMTTGYFLYAKK